MITEPKTSSNGRRHVHNLDLRSEDQQQAIRDQLGRLLSNHLFNHSKRYPAFLTFVIEKTLQGQSEELKERTLGVEVFKRPADYDANANPIVRVTAGEIRKRLAQYYYESGHENELRIELPTGSYVPTFHAPDATVNPSVEQGTALPTIPKTGWSGHRWVSYPALWVSVAGLVVLLSAFFYRSITADSVVDQFWSQVVASRQPVTLSLGQNIEKQPGSGIVISDIGTMSKIRDTLESHQRKFEVVNASATDLSSMKTGPIVFVGPFHTPWVLGLTDSLRYHFVIDDVAHTSSIQDTQFPAQRNWVEPRTSNPPKTYSHAIVARFMDRSIGRPVVIAAGLSPQATIAAGEVLTNPIYMNSLLQSAPQDWQAMNMEAVIETQITNGAAGPPQIDAVYFWK